MFDNMNNNQNFNNNRPLFNNKYNSGNNIENSRYENQFETSNNFINKNENQEIPPFLGEIKNLNEAVNIEAPSLDVLGPANIMPENITSSNDPLSAYETGNFHFNNNMHQELNGNNSNDSNFSGFSSLPNSEFNPTYQVPGHQFNNENNSNDSNFSGFSSFPNPEFNPTYQVPGHQFNNGNNSNDSNFSGFSSLPNSEFNPTYQVPGHQFNNDYNSKYQVSSQITNNNFNHTIDNFNTSKASFDSNFDTSNSSFQFPSDQIQQQKFESLSGSGINQDVQQLSPSLDNGVIQNSETKDYPLPTMDKAVNDLSIEKEDYSIVNNSINQDTKNEETNIDKLGLDDFYNEPDSLEIMDIDSDENDSTNDGDLSSDMIINQINKVKELVKMLKQNGAKVELEEFDFETMYKIILSFKK